MRYFSFPITAVAAIVASSGVAAAAPHDYCADLKGANTGSACEIHLSDPAYSVDISIPLDYPDQKPIADYISQTRDQFVNSAKSAASGSAPSTLTIKPTEYTSAIPPRGTQAVVFKVDQNLGGTHPHATWKAFNWDQSYRKEITYTTPAKDDKANTPLWRVDDPLTAVAPAVQAGLQQQLAPPPTPPAAGAPKGQPVAATPPPPLPISPVALHDAANYQNFAVVNDGVIFFFDQGVLMPDSAGPLQVLAPRSAIDPMLA